MTKSRKATADMSRTERFLQRAMAALGALLLFGSLAVVLKGAMVPPRPLSISVVETDRYVLGDRTQIEIEAFNRGDEAAASVTLQGATMSGETAFTTVDYIAGRSRTSATLSFAGDLGSSLLTLEATGWVDP